MILHADGNSFYASCEQIYRPDLRGKPVVVLSNNDGIIIALNKEAKSVGLKRGEPFFKVENICHQFNVNVFSSNYTLYADISQRITSIYLEYAPAIEEYSIDESFLFFDDCNWTKKEYEELGFDLKRRIYKEVGMPICVGAAPTKTLAKLYNKKAKEHGGVFVYDKDSIDELLEKTDCQTIWGIGPARADKLARHGIKNALMLKHMPLCDAKRLMTVQGFATVQELNGIRAIDKVERQKKDIITSSRQFSKRIYDLKTLECALVQYTQLAVERLRQQKSECGSVHIHISTCNYYSTDEESQYSNGICVTLPRMTSYTPDIVKAAQMALPHIFRAGYGYKTIMVTLYEILPEACQGYLWIDPMEDERKRNFMKTLDKLSANYGRQVVTLAKGMAIDGWQMKRQFLSPCFTTRLEDFPKVY
ncbi:MAG: Y-family DNA polymerase [Treponema sp.]|nr:Y-family DNA polymerase [Treponema sp.]